MLGYRRGFAHNHNSKYIQHVAFYVMLIIRLSQKRIAAMCDSAVHLVESRNFMLHVG